MDILITYISNIIWMEFFSKSFLYFFFSLFVDWQSSYFSPKLIVRILLHPMLYCESNHSWRPRTTSQLIDKAPGKYLASYIVAVAELFQLIDSAHEKSYWKD